MKHRCLMGAAAAAAVLNAGPALAQMDEIVVEATRREADLQSVPLAVTALGAEQIAKLQIDTTQDIGDNVPNLQTYTVTAGAQALQLHARGASVQNPGFNTSESPVGFYVDDVYHGRLASINLDLTDIERIEVLRGPQATLYGRNTIAGAVKVITRSPGDELFANASVGAGDYDTVQAKGAIGGPIIEGALAASLAVNYHQRDEGWIDNPTTGDELGEFENKIGRLKLHYYGIDNLDVNLSVWGVDAQNDGYNGIPYVPFLQSSPTGPASPLGNFYDNFSSGGVSDGDTDQSGGNLQVTWDVWGMQLRSITAIADIDDEFSFDLAGGGLGGVAGSDGLLVDSSSNMDSWSQEFQLLGTSFSDKLSWIAGFFYLNEDGDQVYTGVLAPFFDFREDVENETDSYAAFAEGTWQFTDRLSATVGLRWSKDEKDYRITCSDGPGGGNSCTPTPSGSFTVSLDENYDEWTPKFGLDYQINEKWLTYLTAAKGFQAGGFQTLCFGNLQCAARDYDPQTVWSYEAGFKGDMLDDTVRLNAAVFYAAYEDIQQTVPTPVFDNNVPPNIIGTTFPLDNVDDVDVWGVELETFWTPVENLNFFGSLGFMDADDVSATGNDLPSNPDLTVRLGFDYTRELTSAIELFFGADLNYSDNYYTEVNNDLQIDDYTRGNGFIGIGRPDGRWQLVGTMKNISDEDDNVSGLNVPFATNIRTPLPPREYMVTLKVAY
ncbi:MAG: TonB-dependent receptor [Chromatiales bacterium]|nr:MAG: TonB-dependent receptor [Chromatiales bacterium]